ncbi:MAG: polysaccharide deacetylase family protein [Acidobacteria bacterium]|nr:polysaccharide deacetylase family protein [Acidobacteriota bacterium]
MLFEALGAGAASAAAVMAWGVRGRSSQMFAPSRWRGSREKKLIALTFDDGPSESTPKLLALLERYRIRATFFQCGMHAERLPGVAREVGAAGHEIGNHTFSHAALYLRPGSFIENEVGRAQAVLSEITGARPQLFRATYGVRWFGLRQAQERNGLMGVMWTVLGLDWKLGGVKVARRLVDGASNGGIFCLHDGRERGIRPDISATIDGVERAVPELESRGLLCLKN